MTEVPPIRVPVQGSLKRDIEHISPEEIHAAMRLILQHDIGMSAESLINQSARLFGFSKTGSNIKQRLSREYQTLLEKGIITQNDNTVTLNIHHNP
jgi:hypothetical protein